MSIKGKREKRDRREEWKTIHLWQWKCVRWMYLFTLCKFDLHYIPTCTFWFLIEIQSKENNRLCNI